jgi:DNA polymerase III sliding clamp (beta) subunit (PCNA family)
LVTDKETVVTDGYILCRVSHPKGGATVKPETFPVVEGFAPGDEFKRVLLHAADAKEIARAIPKKTTIPVLKHAALSITGDKIQVAVTDLDTPRVFTPRSVTGQFPNWECVIPKQPPAFEITVDAHLLLQLARYAAEFCPGDAAPVRLQFQDADSAVRLDACNNETGQGMTALLMPLRGGGARNVWNYPDAAAAEDSSKEAEGGAA